MNLEIAVVPEQALFDRARQRARLCRRSPTNENIPRVITGALSEVVIERAFESGVATRAARCERHETELIRLHQLRDRAVREEPRFWWNP